MRIFITGGCKNGKSHFAQRLAKRQGIPLYYVATMVSTGQEDDERIRRHIADREGWGFETLEVAKKIERLPQMADPNGSFLLDSVTALLFNEMFDAHDELDKTAPARVLLQLRHVVRALPNLVLVSDYIYSDALRFDDATQAYRRGLGQIECMLAQECETVVETCFSCQIVHKGALIE